MNHFETYAKKATSIASRHPSPLIGPTRTRCEAMLRYQEIVEEIRACEDADMLHAYLVSIRKDIAQFRAELDFLWLGDGADFLGIHGEINQAIQQFPANPESEAERIFGQLEQETGT